MAYNKAKEEYKWKVWKEQEEKKLRELGVSEEVIAELRDYDWNCFKQERNYKNHQMPDTDFIERTEDASGKWEIQQPVNVQDLIIVRLPFAVPDPVREAERERYQTLKEYIQKIIVPDMQIKLRQGFGRAIRTETDTCVVSILDSRAGRGGKYHKEVIDALPVCRITDRMADVENFIRNRKRIEYYM